MTLTPSKDTTRQALESHGWLGLAAALMMYLICLSGALVVLNPYIARWEQPQAEEYSQIDETLLQRAYLNTLDADSNPASFLFITLPTEASPRAKIASDSGSFYINKDGSLGQQVVHGWMDIITNLHVYLHLPFEWGMVAVSVFGVALCALVISGFMAHRRIIKDAFSFRFNAGKSQQQTDIHNRLSVWFAPFHLMFGITGAYFGLAGLLGALYASVYFDGDEQAVQDAVYAEEPVLEHAVEPANLVEAMQALREAEPDASPFYITLEKSGTAQQYILIGATLPGRLMYGEQYRFDNQGHYINKVGFSDGENGRQAVFSVFRLHFGHFGPLIVPLFYVFLGIVLAVISVSGVNIWLSKRPQQDYLNDIWTGAVWGAPFALISSALVELVAGASSVWLFWGGLACAIVIAFKIQSRPRTVWFLAALNLVMLLAIVITHSVLFAANAWRGGALLINLLWLTCALFFILQGMAIINSARQR